MRQVRTISLFSGCGGSDLALQRLGYDIVWANDISQVACETYRDNVGPNIECGDIADFHRFPNADFLVGCYPCQGFTQGGRRDWGASINYMYQRFDRILRTISPKAFVVENVNGMAYGENRQLLSNQLVRYRLAGYRVKWQVLDAQDAVDNVMVTPAVLDYLLAFVRATRSETLFEVGVSPRGAIDLLKAVRAWALLRGRTFVVPDDVKTMAPYVASHRILRRGSRKGASRADIDRVFEQVSAPA